MSTAPRRKENRRPRTEDQGRKASPPVASLQAQVFNRQFALTACALAVFAGIPFALGKYFELMQPDPYDSAIYVYSAQRVLQGAEIGVDEIPSAQIGTLLMNMLGVALGGFNEIGPKVVQGLLQLGALVLMFTALRRLFGTLGASVSVILASLYLSAPMVAKYGNVKEQFMIAFLIMGISCFVLYQLSGRWWQAMLAGALLSWAPLFKQTGMSAVVALGLFVLAQPLLRRQTVRQAAGDLGLLLAGAAAALAPLYIWILGFGVKMPLPYDWVGFVFARLLPSSSGAADPNVASGDYISSSRQAVTLAEQARMVFRYYRVLALPVVMSLLSIVVRLIRLAGQVKTRSAAMPHDRLVLLFGMWWFLDMAFVWISPRPYEQYYLPLNGSAAMLAGYGVAVYRDKLRSALFRKEVWAGLGAAGLVAMVILAWPVLAGTKISPSTGARYDGGRARGYRQKLEEIKRRAAGEGSLAFEAAGDYIRQRSTDGDKIYVWGWIPGIYIRAQRFSSVPIACTSEMHVYPPAALSVVVADILEAFEKEPVRYLVDTHNRHFPYDGRPPLELWPIVPNKGFLSLAWADRAMLLPMDPVKVQEFETRYAQYLSQPRPDNPGLPRWPDEAARFAALKPLRDYVMRHYQVAQVIGTYVILQRKAAAPDRGLP